MNEQMFLIIIAAAGLLSFLYYGWLSRYPRLRRMIWLPSLFIVVCLAGVTTKFLFFQQGYSAIIDIISFIVLGSVLVIHLLVVLLVNRVARAAVN
ncbi:hypothetical protein EBB07_21130 [Paenibacillaceae bacterium]|nr:hypothetical protein EBB07_21130 [Paenibacillaceae bacterium]